ncbi:UDP-N-acetylmuramoyl-tripeptide--D-alanyl-D-alanine ligase [Paenibacillus daejeonensis]|uniref:UDP-N-acetylmuramoyl-tripeptide--D-alanyl-D- alanine ligase n=1 Tax=Paenibacillus daejeonensis TaxID=135193 RepID=UPI00037CBA2E|nr:UDP-N-acetylmuramoyl-tripeptide--D-alanyl-D-alanine ligase [Paenibacillus daejeonensis]
MIHKSIAELAALCGGRLHTAHAGAGQERIAGVSTDTRTIATGQLFVPLIGDRFDGHAYAVAARERGAAAALWQEDHELPAALADWPVILVEDTLVALQRMAAAYRSELSVRIVGITGSNGKTTTKDMVAAALATVFRVHKTAGNLNNHIGLPLTVLEMDETTEAAVLEMGMSGYGEIQLLSEIARPDLAIITNIGDAHMQQLGSREGIAKAKLEIAEGLKPGGTLLLNGDEALLAEDAVSLPAGIQVLRFGRQPGNDYVVLPQRMDAASSSFSLHDRAGMLTELSVPAAGIHNMMNATAAVAAALELGVPYEQIAAGLAGMELSAMRIERSEAFNGATVLNDAYNANPTAMRAAIDLVEQLQGYRHKWLVLGDMLELGDQEEELHRGVGRYITPVKADQVLTFGQLGSYIAEGAAVAFHADPEAVKAFDDKEKLATWLRSQLAPEDLVLVKGSRGTRMEQIVQAIQHR